MNTPGLYLVASLSASGAATDAAEPEVTQPVPPPVLAEPVTDKPVRPEPKHKGIGLAATAGGLGAVSLGVVIARNVLLKKNCPLDSMNAGECTYDFGSDIGLAATQWVVNIGIVGFAPAAGSVMGKYDGWKDTQSGRAPRKARALMAGGGGLLGAGIVGVGTSIALAFVLPKRCVDKELEGTDPLAGDRCLLKAYPAWTVTNWASFSMIGVGAGMLAYGRSYKRHRPEAFSTMRLTPYAGPTYAGVGLSGRF